MMGDGNRNSMTATHQGSYAPDHDGFHHDGFNRPPQPYMQDPYMQHGGDM